MWPGNTADVKTLLPVVKRMRQRFRLREITVVADHGMVSKATPATKRTANNNWKNFENSQLYLSFETPCCKT